MKTEVEFFEGKDKLTYWHVVETKANIADNEREIIACSDQGYSPEEARQNFNDCFLTPWRVGDEGHWVFLTNAEIKILNVSLEEFVEFIQRNLDESYQELFDNSKKLYKKIKNL